MVLLVTKNERIICYCTIAKSFIFNLIIHHHFVCREWKVWASVFVCVSLCPWKTIPQPTFRWIDQQIGLTHNRMVWHPCIRFYCSFCKTIESNFQAVSPYQQTHFHTYTSFSDSFEHCSKVLFSPIFFSFFLLLIHAN